LQISTLPYCNSGETLAFSIISAADNEAIGYVSVKGITAASPAAEVGIAIMGKEYRGQGYSTEALALATQYACNELGLAEFRNNLGFYRRFEALPKGGG